MKTFYTYILGMIMLLSTIILGASEDITSEHLIRLANERNTNLVIINDVQEYVLDPDNMISYMVDRRQKLNVSSMHSELLSTLSSNQLVLCPRLLWHSVQNIVGLFQQFAFTDSRLYPIDSDFVLYCVQCRLLKDFYDQINRVNASSDGDKRKKVGNLIDQLQAVLNDPTIDVLMRYNMQEMFAVYMHYENIIKQEYICKQVTKKRTDFDAQENDFLLFVPQRFKNISRNVVMQDAWLGLSWTTLPDYKYQEVISKDYLQKIMYVSQSTLHQNQQGEQLLKALDIIKFDRADVPRELCPFLNVYLTGHGSPKSMTAEISILPKTNRDGSRSSDFIKVLKTFNNYFRTQSLVILSCYTGGKKIIDTYQLDNYYSHAVLENLSYTLILVGSTFQSSSVNTIGCGLSFEKVAHFSKLGLYLPPCRDIISKYFANLEKLFFLDYEKAVKVLFQGVENIDRGIVDIKKPENYVSIKFPHVAWFSAVKFPTYVQQLSQIAMATVDKPIVISKDIKLLLLSANYILQPIHFDFNVKLPKLLPVNYMNQHYYFDSVVMHQEEGPWALIFSKLFVPNIKEPIIIVFKEVTLKREILSDVIIFMHYDLYGDGNSVSGYMYTKASGETKIAAWPSNEKMPTSAIETLDSIGISPNLVSIVKDKIQKTLPPALHTEFISKLNREMAAKKHAKNIDDSNVRWVKEPTTGKWKELPSESLMSV